MFSTAAATRCLTPKPAMPLPLFYGRGHSICGNHRIFAPPTLSKPRANTTLTTNQCVCAAPFKRRGQLVQGTHSRFAPTHPFTQRGHRPCVTHGKAAALHFFLDAATLLMLPMLMVARPPFPASRQPDADTQRTCARSHLLRSGPSSHRRPSHCRPDHLLRPVANDVLPTN